MALRRVLIYLGAVFLMSHIILSNNVGAISTNLSFDDIIVKGSSLTPTVACNINGAAALIQYSWCYHNGTNIINTLNDIHTVDSFVVDSGDYIEFDLVIRTDTEVGTLGSYYLEDVNIYVPSGMRLVSRDMVINSTFGYDSIVDGSTSSNESFFYHVYRYVFRYVGNETTNIQLGLRQQSASRGYVKFIGNTVYFRLANVVVYEGVTSSQSQDQKNEINETNNAVDNSETSGDQASSDATTATSSLLSVIGGFVNVITSASPSNCVIDAPLNTAFSNDRFNVDLCALNLPSGITALTSIIAIMIIVPFCISMFNKFIGIISGFQQ